MSPLFSDKRQKRDDAGPFYRLRDSALMKGTQRGLARRPDFSLRSHKLLQQINVFIVNLINVVVAKVTILISAHGSAYPYY